MSKRWYAFLLEQDSNGKYYIPAGSNNITVVDGRYGYWNASTKASEAFRKVRSSKLPWHGFILAKLPSVAHKANSCFVMGNIHLEIEEALRLINCGAYK